MEVARRYIEEHPTRFAAYVALQCALMRHYLARGGTQEDFCLRLAPVFHRRYAPLLLDRHPAGR
jgi:hypothetical protein